MCWMFYRLPVHQQIAAPNSLVTIPAYEAPTIGRLWKGLVGVQGLNCHMVAWSSVNIDNV